VAIFEPSSRLYDSIFGSNKAETTWLDAPGRQREFQ